ncbi:DEAD/DEAH box helicase [Saccharicrinis aurantiacus]|uniref:DEAD/DEAH box helicase n=1 Tax=Saccharicrinis aurantiacus TaxID=1849719 RepID=UPI00083826AB|nr:DEAD/DEAH box helicase [Saccharicrinis aurantiacus]
MTSIYKNKEAILNKLGIEALNDMQNDASKAIQSSEEVVLLSPTGTGKTLAFLLPIIEQLDPENKDIQVLVLVHSRELAIQIEQVTREIGSGYKTNAVYGGRAGNKDRAELKHAPSILIGTPGRVADHIRSGVVDAETINFLVLDEFDKCLEVGFEKEMSEILGALPSLKRKVLTSATQKVKIPEFVGLTKPKTLNLLKASANKLVIKVVTASSNDKLESLGHLLSTLNEKTGIIFCNFKDTIHVVRDFLEVKNVDHAVFYGGQEQVDRERSLVKFRNGTNNILLASDLAARGIDVPNLDFIIHFQLPGRPDEFIHRNGRTARMNSDGTAYILKTATEELPSFVKDAEAISIKPQFKINGSYWRTLYISGGRKDKISKGDIAGLFFKQGNLEKNELGTIEVKQDYSFVAVPRKKTHQLIADLNNSRVKKKKVRISLLQ